MATNPSLDSKYPVLTDLINALLAIQRDYRTVSLEDAIAEVVVARQAKANLVENLEAKDTLIANLNTSIANLTTALGTKLPSATYTEEDVLTKILAKDGAGSGLDADKFQGKAPSEFILQSVLNGNFDTAGSMQIPVKQNDGSIKNLILQWGTATTGDETANGTFYYATAPITFPTPFTTKCIYLHGIQPNNTNCWVSETLVNLATGTIVLSGVSAATNNKNILWLALGY